MASGASLVGNGTVGSIWQPFISAFRAGTVSAPDLARLATILPPENYPASPVGALRLLLAGYEETVAPGGVHDCKATQALGNSIAALLQAASRFGEVPLEKPLAGDTAITGIDTETGLPVYRGYAVQDLVAQCTPEEVAHLLIFGELPSAEQLASFRHNESTRRTLTPEMVQIIKHYSMTSHPMDVLRQAVGSLSLEEGAAKRKEAYDVCFELLAKVPTIVANILRTRCGKEITAPDPTLHYAENFLAMALGEKPPSADVNIFDQFVILGADMGYTASTFAARITQSTATEPDPISAVVSAISTAKGARHGGASKDIIRMLQSIDDPEGVSAWVDARLKQHQRIPGFGSRIYKGRVDPRFALLQKAVYQFLVRRGQLNMVKKIAALRRCMAERNLYPNAELGFGPTMNVLDFDGESIPMVLMVIRLSGLLAHIKEQIEKNRIIAHTGKYTGSFGKKIS